MISRLVNPFRISGGRLFSVMATTMGPVQSSIHEKLTSLLQPTQMVIRNDSSKHRHHVAMRDYNGNNGETHFSIRIVSDTFKGKSPIQRHRMINSILADEFAQGLHALSLETKTEEEVARASES